MKKIELKFAAQKMTKEQMKPVTGGTVCAATIYCYNTVTESDFGPIYQSIDCGNADFACQNADSGEWPLDSHASSCTCS